VQYCSLPDPEKYLYMFSGLPANYRLSVLSEISRQRKHALETLVCASDGINTVRS